MSKVKAIIGLIIIGIIVIGMIGVSMIDIIHNGFRIDAIPVIICCGIGGLIIAITNLIKK